MASTTSAKAIGKVTETVESTAPQGPQLQLPFFRAFTYTFLTAGAFLFVMPFLWMISTSLMTQGEIARGVFLPQSELLGVHLVEDADLERPLGEFLPPSFDVEFQGAVAEIVYDAGPDGGTFDVLIDGQRIDSINTHSDTYVEGQIFTIDTYPSVATLGDSQNIALPDARHSLSFVHNIEASEGDQLNFRGLIVTNGEGEISEIAASDFEFSVGYWESGIVDDGTWRAARWNEAATQWEISGEAVDAADLVRRSSNLGFPEYLVDCCQAVVARSRSNQETEQGRYITERQSGGLAQLDVNLPFGLLDQSYVLTGGISHYVKVWDDSNFSEYFVNSAIITLLTVVLQTLFSVLAAYAFARMDFPGKNVLFSIFLMTLFIPTMVILIPNLLTVTSISQWSEDTLGPIFVDIGEFTDSAIGITLLTAEDAKWMDRWPALVIPFLASTFSIFLLRQFFMQIPNELWDAARIDGAGHLRFLFQIVVPISRAAITTVVLFTFIGTWDALEWPILVTTSEDWRPIAYGLYQFQNEEGARPNLLMSGAMIALFPVILMYFIAQKQFTEGIATTGLKG